MTKDEAISKTYKYPRDYIYKPTMLSYERCISAMDLYTDSKVKLIISNEDEIKNLSDYQLRKKIIDLLYNNGADAIVDYIKGNIK